MTSPTLTVFAGPNGSGKSTITETLLPDALPYVNADEIQRELSCSPKEAADIAEATREGLLSQGGDFAFETVLSTDMNLDLMARAREAGYQVRCYYVLTSDPAINISRVRARVSRGGHSVPEEKIVARYIRALELFPRLLAVCDELSVFDNSLEHSQRAASLIARFQHGTTQICPNESWPEEAIRDLLDGRYPQRIGLE